MTVTYDPKDPRYHDPAVVRAERDRVFDLCHGCRLCWNLCPSFASLFDLIDTVRDDDPFALSDAEHDRIVDECYQCKICYVKCPYVPPHEWALDFPKLMTRSVASRVKANGGRTGTAERFLASTDLIGRSATVSPAVAGLANRINASTAARTAMEKVIGVAKERVLPDFTKERFSRWFRRRQGDGATQGTGRRPAERTVAFFPTCLVEYQQASIGKDVVRVYERNGVDVELPEGTVCCGMPWQDAGDLDRFVEHARKNVGILRRFAERGRTIVVPQPTCGYVLKKDYPAYLGTEDAAIVAKATKDVSEDLHDLHRQGALDTDFEGGQTWDTITWHQPCHLKAQNIGYRSRDLMALTGATVTVVDKCSAIDGTWGYRAENYELARKVAQAMKRGIEKAGSQLVAGDCHLANSAIEQETGQTPIHPVQVVARAYGIPEE